MIPKQHVLALFFCVCAASATQAADTTPAAPSAPSWQSEARQAIKAQKFDAAVDVLKSAGETTSADWHNLMGFSLRKKSPPDLVRAEQHYQQALSIDPKHKDALEYYGELLLMKNNLAGAEQMLARLEKACFLRCEQKEDLKAAIAAYKNKK